MRKYLIDVLVCLLLVSIIIAACTPASPPPPADKVSVRLKWPHSAQFAGFYAAEQMGYYAGENLAVTLDPGSFSDDKIELISSGDYDFFVMGALHSMLLGGDQSPFMTIAVIYRIDPNVQFALQGSGITEPQDFVGKRVMYYPADAVFPAFMNRLDIGMDQFETVLPSEAGIEDFLDGSVDVWTGYLPTQVVELRLQGYDLNIIHPGDYGIHIYRDAIVTSKTLAENNPLLAERFLRASLRGWRYAIENPDETVDMVLDYNPGADAALEKAVIEAQQPLVHTGDGEIGWMRPEIWQGMDDLLLEQEITTQPMDLDKVYTMRFLNAVYDSEVK